MERRNVEKCLLIGGMACFDDVEARNAVCTVTVRDVVNAQQAMKLFQLVQPPTSFSPALQ